MYKTVLVPVDLSHPEQGRRTLALARRIGGAKARMVALYVAPEVPGFVAAALPPGLLKENLEKARGELAALAGEKGVEFQVRTGHVSTAILEAAGAIGADLIVIASHRPGLEDYFLGSTAARVVRHAACAVLVER